jgi:hypothetical protein
MLYAIVLFAHSLLRWVILPAAVFLCVRSFLAARNGRSWGRGDEKLHVVLVSTIDLQFLLGLLLYAFLSPFSRAFFEDVQGSMKDAGVRFFAVEHVIGMLIAIVVLHIGRARSKRATADARRHRVVWITTLIALVLILLSIPWPGFPYARPLLRGLAFG